MSSFGKHFSPDTLFPFFDQDRSGGRSFSRFGSNYRHISRLDVETAEEPVVGENSERDHQNSGDGSGEDHLYGRLDIFLTHFAPPTVLISGRPKDPF